MNELENVLIEDVRYTLDYLKEGYILYNKTNNSFVYFKLDKDIIRVKDNNATYSLTKEEYCTLFKDYKFKIKDNNSEELVDPLKDEEYYNFKHK